MKTLFETARDIDADVDAIVDKLEASGWSPQEKVAILQGIIIALSEHNPSSRENIALLVGELQARLSPTPKTPETPCSTN
jgi:hypothetical protein